MKLSISLFTLGCILSLQASAGLNCQSQMDSFKSLAGDCSFGNQQSCDRVCSVLQPVNNGSCTNSELENARRQGEQRAMQNIYSDLKAEGVAQITAVGSTPEDCQQNAKKNAQMAQTAEQQAITQCNSQIRVLTGSSCSIVTTRLAQAQKIAPFKAQGAVYNSWVFFNNSPDECKKASVSAAEKNAMSACQNATGGAPCHVTSSQNVSIVSGSDKKLGLICNAVSVAEAMPDANYQYTCAIEVVAKIMVK